MNRRTDPLLVGILVVAAVLFGWGIWRIWPHQILGDEWSVVGKSLLMTFHNPVMPTFRKGGNLHMRVLGVTNLFLAGYWWLTGLLPTAVNDTAIYASRIPLDPGPLLTVYNDALLAARVVSVAAGVAAVAAVYGLTRELAGRQAGLISAGVLAASPGFATLAHHATEDTLQIMLIVVSLLLLVRAVAADSRRGLQLAAITTGLAVSSKATSGALLAPFALAIWWVATDRRDFSVLAVESGIIALLAYFATTPSAVVYPLTWAGQIISYTGLSITTIPIPGQPESTATTRSFRTAPVNLLSSLGAALFVTGLAAVAASTWGLARRRYDRRLGIVLIFGAAYGLMMVPPRMPQYPRLIVLHPVLAVCMGVVAAGLLARHRSVNRRAIGTIMVGVIVLTAASTAFVVGDFATSRREASLWAADNIDPGATVDNYGYRAYRAEPPDHASVRTFALNDPDNVDDRRVALVRIKNACPKYVFLNSRYYSRFLSGPTVFPRSKRLVQSLLSGEAPYRQVARFGPPPLPKEWDNQRLRLSMQYPPSRMHLNGNLLVLVFERKPGVQPTNCRTE